MVKVNLEGVQDSLEYPAGQYHLALVDGEIRQTSETSKHPDNDFWNLEFLIQDGQYEGKPMFMNVMLPPYQVFTLKNILRATGQFSDEDLESGDFDVELLPEDAEDDSTFVLLQDPPLEFIGIYGKNRKSGNMELRRLKEFDEDEWVPADGDASELP